jgi:hypothetical protein
MVGVGDELTVSLVAVMVAEPAATAVITVVPVVPDAGLTDRTPELLEVKVTTRPVSILPLASFTVAVSGCAPPTTIAVCGDERVTVATGTGVTVMEDVPVFVSLVAVIVTGPPTDTAVTNPF